jgi:hypothetical protein
MKLQLHSLIFAFSLMYSSGSLAQESSVGEPLVIDEAEALAMDARIYADAYGVTIDEAINRLTVMLYGGQGVVTATNSEGADFGGKFFDNGVDFGLVVRSRAPKEPRGISFRPETKTNYGRMNAAAKRERNATRRTLRQQLLLSDSLVSMAEDALSKPHQLKVKSQKTDITLAQLNRGIEDLRQTGASVEGYNLAYVNERDGVINLILDREIPENAQAQLRNIAKVPITFEILPGGMQQVANIRGGSKLYTSSTATSTSPRYCMSAFGARHNTSKTSTGAYVTGLVTAAHCASTSHIIGDNGTNYPVTLGSVMDDRGGVNKADLRFIYNANNNPVGVGQFYFDGTTNVRNATGTRTRNGTNIGGGTPDTVSGTTTGTFVCHLGQTGLGSANSIQSCGEVISITASQSSTGASASQSGGYFVMVRNTQSGAGTVRSSGTGTLRCYQGDSGGPFFSGTIAFGVLSSCGWSGGLNSDTAKYAMYTSTDYFADLGVTILVP